MKNLRRVGAALVCAGAAATAVAVGCSSNSSPSGSGPSNEDAGGNGADAGSTLYARLGGHAGIRGAVDKVVGAELGDPDIASYFVFQTMVPAPAGHPNVDQLEECFTDQLANAAGGPESYPTTVTDDAGSWTCRDMSAIHAPFDISGGTFAKFVMIAAGELQSLGVASADVATIGSVLNGAQPVIVDPTLADAGELPFAYDAGASSTVDAGPPVDAGPDAATTLYQRLGGHAGIRAAVNDIVGAELGDPDLASYFFNQVTTPTPAGHPNVDQLEECFTDLLANAAGGSEAYPTTVTDDAGAWACRGDMTAIHASLHISGGTFSKFVVIAAGELQTLGVATSDITTIGSVLNGQETAVVDPNLADAGEMAYDAASP
jgi:hypothetical protein